MTQGSLFVGTCLRIGNAICSQLTRPRKEPAYLPRLETPGWKNADNCEVCDSPFFWNISAMWQRRVKFNFSAGHHDTSTNPSRFRWLGRGSTIAEHAEKRFVALAAQIGQRFLKWATSCLCVYATNATREWKKIRNCLSKRFFFLHCNTYSSGLVRISKLDVGRYSTGFSRLLSQITTYSSGTSKQGVCVCYNGVGVYGYFARSGFPDLLCRVWSFCYRCCPIHHIISCRALNSYF